MLLPAYLIVPSAIIVIISLPVYFTLLTTLWKYRKKSPFNSAFFITSFHLGVLDFCHLFNNWVVGSLPYLGLHDFVAAHGDAFGKQYSMVWWYTALGRKLGVILLAVDRVATMWLNKRLSRMHIRIHLVFIWLLPMVLTAPQAFTQFAYHIFNDTSGVLLYWVDHHYQMTYYRSCFLFCGVTSVICGISYGLAFHKIYKHQRNLTMGGRDRTDTKLAVVGFIQVFITFLCSCFCGLMTSVTEINSQIVMMGFEQLLFVVYSCLNPYLILVCSKSAWIHFKSILLCRSPEKFQIRSPEVLHLLRPLRSFFPQQAQRNFVEIDTETPNLV